MRRDLPLVAAYLAVLGAVVVAALGRTGGLLVYTLDDPYIHLALSEGILSGHYGLNPGETSAPSSSVVWPFLLAPFAWSSLHPLVPMALNVLAGVALVVILARFVRGSWEGVGEPGRVLLVVPLVLVGSGIALPFTGMEHAAHVALTAAAALGLLLTEEEPPAWLGPVLMAGPLVRYEALAVTVPALALLALAGHRRWALRWSALTALPLALFSGALVAAGLEPLPSSVLAKLDLSADVELTVLGRLRSTFGLNVLHRQGMLMALFALFALPCAVLARRKGVRLLCLTAAAAGTLHLAFGEFGWFARYEVYAVLFVVLAPVAWVGERVAGMAPDRGAGSGRVLVVALGALLVGVGWPYVETALRTPAASRRIYEQQYQMHRFVVEWVRGPVGVNDLGWVSYRNPHYVLDFMGLANLESLARRRGGWDPGDAEALARKYDVPLAMVYPSWVTPPASWSPLAVLGLSSIEGTHIQPRVVFYATEPALRPGFERLLRDFAPTLPAGVELTLLRSGPPASPEG